MYSRRLLVLVSLLSVLVLHQAYAQDMPVYMGSEPQPIRISTGAVYQQYSDEDRRLSQIAFPVSAFIPLTRNLGFTLISNPVLIDGEQVEAIQGLSDSQAALSYFQPIGEGSLVVSLSTNLPSGKRELTAEEFATTALLSQDFYRFGVPVLGQGLNITPGITIAYPISDNAAAGLGASYQLKGGFKPVQGMVDSFTPGDELLVTGGIDVRVAPSWALSSNVSYIIYQNDQLGDVDVFESGDQLFASLQLLGNMGSNQLRLIGRFRSKAKSLLPAGGALVTAPRTVPQQYHLTGTYSLMIQDNLRATLIAGIGYYDETDFFTSKTRFDLGASQEYAFTEIISSVLRFVYTFGSFPGVEVAGGLVFTIR